MVYNYDDMCLMGQYCSKLMAISIMVINSWLRLLKPFFVHLSKIGHREIVFAKYFAIIWCNKSEKVFNPFCEKVFTQKTNFSWEKAIDTIAKCIPIITSRLSNFTQERRL